MEITLVNLIAILFHFPWFSEKLHYISYEALNGENVQSGRKLVQINNCRDGLNQVSCFSAAVR